MTTPLAPPSLPDKAMCEGTMDNGIWSAYYEALSAYWESRCRVAVEALQELAQSFWVDKDGKIHLLLSEDSKFHHADDCVNLIGPCPSSPLSRRGVRREH